MAEIMARGPNFVCTKEVTLQKYGERAWQQVLEAPPNDAADIWIWIAPPFAYGSYPFRAFKQMVSALSRELTLVKDSENSQII